MTERDCQRRLIEIDAPTNMIMSGIREYEDLIAHKPLYKLKSYAMGATVCELPHEGR